MDIKEENEITMRILCEIEELCGILENKGFNVVDRFVLEDIYMIPNVLSNKIGKCANREILKEAVLIRNVASSFTGYKNKMITFKSKQFCKNGEILDQKVINCNIDNIEVAVKLFEAIHYDKIMTIVEKDVVYAKSGLQIAIKNIENGDNLIEIETVSSNEKMNTIDKVKKLVIDLQIPVDCSDFFIKKAEIELNRLLVK